MSSAVPQAAEPRSKARLVGRPLLYAISCFASLGVFLVRAFHISVGIQHVNIGNDILIAVWL